MPQRRPRDSRNQLVNRQYLITYCILNYSRIHKQVINGTITVLDRAHVGSVHRVLLLIPGLLRA